MTDFKTTFKAVKNLAVDFKANERLYLSPKYSEAEVRKDYIDKFFTALGWDVNHNIQKNPYEQEVKVEKTQSNQKRTDYTFFLLPNFKDPKFFVEAKKPQRNLCNADDYFQTIRYGWNANTPIAVLTDFEEFHILDCRFKPNINTVLPNKNHKQFHYTDYADLEKFKEIYYLFSREAIADNSLEKYADSLPKPKGKAVRKGLPRIGYQTIDEDFLEYIDDTRETLAKAFKKNDTSLTSEELTEATQRTIDRLVFIRFLEDKLIEPDNYVTEFGNGGNSWNDFIAASRKLNSKYNGIVFKKHFIDEKNFKGPDENEFDQICEEISHLNSPYDFNAIPIHILGSIYERFLGKVVHATDKRVKVEEKPEVRKAGGVYYTPKYIVDYIVQNTVGKLINDKTPKEISEMHFADIACGSGSFLISVFECLLEYHNNYYQENRKQAKKDGCLEKDGAMVLSIKQKQEILQNNIYGVDIDQQATEVTQLSLALKMLEDETTATANDMQVLFHEKILPNLSKNIVCGNSLIGSDILSNNMFESEEERKLNPMDFGNVFPEIMRNGGFDAIVGNPPYVRVDILQKSHKNYIINNYNSAKGKYDLYYLFLERAFTLINKNGNMSYILPNRFTTSDSGLELRKFLINNCNKIFINSVSKIKVFKNAATYPNIIVLEGKGIKAKELVLLETKTIEELNLPKHKVIIDSNEIKKLPNFIFPLNSNKIIIDLYFRLSSICTLSEKILVIQEGLRIPKEIEKEKGDFHIVKQYQFSRYSSITKGSFVNKNKLSKNINLNSVRILNCLKPKIIFAEDALCIESILDLSKSICQGGVYFGTLLNDLEINLKYLLALFNSKLLTTIYMNLFSGMHMGGGYLRFRTSFLNKLPLRIINFKNPSEKQSHDKIVNLVNQMLESKKQLHSARTDKDKSYYERKCNRLDKQIDSEVYKLYDLTNEEIKIVEGKNNGP